MERSTFAWGIGFYEIKDAMTFWKTFSCFQKVSREISFKWNIDLYLWTDIKHGAVVKIKYCPWSLIAYLKTGVLSRLKLFTLVGCKTG
jgi:hypothetical protein